MVKNPLWPCASTASFSPRSATRRARMGPSGGMASPNRRRSALANGRSQAKALSATNQVRVPCLSPSRTSGRAMATSATSSSLTTPAAPSPQVGDQPLAPPGIGGVALAQSAKQGGFLDPYAVDHTDQGNDRHHGEREVAAEGVERPEPQGHARPHGAHGHDEEQRPVPTNGQRREVGGHH